LKSETHSLATVFFENAPDAIVITIAKKATTVFFIVRTLFLLSGIFLLHDEGVRLVKSNLSDDYFRLRFMLPEKLFAMV
jgi:hypothetical protein